MYSMTSVIFDLSNAPAIDLSDILWQDFFMKYLGCGGWPTNIME